MLGRTFNINLNEHFSSLRSQGVAISAEQETIARRVYDQQNTSGDFFSWFMNAIMSGLRAVGEFIGGSSGNLEDAATNGQQRGDMDTAARTAYTIRNQLIANGIPELTAEAMTGAGHTQSQLHYTGNLYQLYTNSRGVTQRNRDAERAYDEARDPQLAQLVISTGSYPVTNNPTVTAPVTPTAGQPAAAPGITS